ncbi:hypothetical protein FEDK69T_19030 [Flavobacterium enshiense DK69]|nr:hypothetical protein FEDK69T_19030 [Flavobacterium enshiense DK69]
MAGVLIIPASDKPILSDDFSYSLFEEAKDSHPNVSSSHFALINICVFCL